jgi:hypothetical protein
MIRSLARKAIVFTALLGFVTSGWACGLMSAGNMPGSQHATVSADNSSALPDNPMRDCQDSGTAKSDVLPLCIALCAMTVTVTPEISRAVAIQIGLPHYPAGPSIRNWLIQPEPYPPRA